MQLALTAFLTGLFSSAHCVAMCGGLVGALNTQRRVINIQPAASMQIGVAADALPLQLAYSGGRIASYASAGAVAGGIGGIATLAQAVLPVQLVLGVAANLLLIAFALHLAGRGRLIAWIEKGGLLLWRRIAPFTGNFLPADTVPKAFAIGALWGWLPCGLVYSMLALALTTGGGMQGATLMAAFGLGTLPALVAAGLFVDSLRALWMRPFFRNVAAGLIAFMGLLGLARIPQLQEAIAAGLLCFTQL